MGKIKSREAAVSLLNKAIKKNKDDPKTQSRGGFLSPLLVRKRRDAYIKKAAIISVRPDIHATDSVWMG